MLERVRHSYEQKRVPSRFSEGISLAGEMIRILMEDNGHIAKMIRDAITVCDKNRDSATSNQLQDILDKTERRKWFLYEVMQGSKNTE
jgi:starvation-inducible DNA-binding protein